MPDVLLRFLNLLALLGFVVFGLRAVLFFVAAVRYEDPRSDLRLSDHIRGVGRTFPWPSNLAYALIAGAWLVAANAP